jgi:hypothetical protein
MRETSEVAGDLGGFPLEPFLVRYRWIPDVVPMNIPTEVLLALGAALLLLLFFEPRWIWSWRGPFLHLNKLHWLFFRPAHRLLRDRHARWPSRIYPLLRPLEMGLTAVAYVLLFAVRIPNSLYFNLFLYLSVNLRNEFADWLRPSYVHLSRREYARRWVRHWPGRTGRFLRRVPLLLGQSLLTTLVDFVWPTLTLFHGTGSRAAGLITTSGNWKAGGGSFAGVGLYFGLEEWVGHHYARHRDGPRVIVSRVMIEPSRSAATLPDEVRRRIGRDGPGISRELYGQVATLVHWRQDPRPGWYEFCLIQPEPEVAVRPWRVRPLCVVEGTTPTRVPGGIATWPFDRRGRQYALTTAAAVLLLLVLGAGFWALRPDPPPLGTTFVLPTPASFCPDIAPTALSVGRGVVTLPPALNVRAEPGADGDVVMTVPAGSRATVVHGPACADRGTWWLVAFPDRPRRGWVREHLPDGSPLVTTADR